MMIRKNFVFVADARDMKEFEIKSKIIDLDMSKVLRRLIKKFIKGEIKL